MLSTWARGEIFLLVSFSLSTYASIHRAVSFPSVAVIHERWGVIERASPFVCVFLPSLFAHADFLFFSYFFFVSPIHCLSVPPRRVGLFLFHLRLCDGRDLCRLKGFSRSSNCFGVFVSFVLRIRRFSFCGASRCILPGSCHVRAWCNSFSIVSLAHGY